MIHSLPSSEPLTAQKLFSKLYVSYYARLVRFASLYVGAMGDAENIVQDFFLYLWERKEILPELQQPDAYLFSAVKHRCLNFLRSQLSIVDRRQPLSDIMEQEFKLKLYSLQLLDDSQMSIDEVEKQICRAIDSLPERSRSTRHFAEYGRRSNGYRFEETSGRIASLYAFAASIERIRINRLCIVFASVHSIYFSQAEY